MMVKYRPLLILLTGWLQASISSAATFEEIQASTVEDFVNSTIDLLSICVKDETSKSAIPSATGTLITRESGQEIMREAESLVALSRSGAADETNSTCFEWTNLPRGGVQIKLEAPNYYTSLLAVNLFIPTQVKEVDLGETVMTRRRNGVARLIFGGDIMFDRRFFEEGILHLGDADGSRLERETAALFDYISPYLESGDHSNVNLECPIVEDRSTPHPSKNYIFACNRPSAQAMPSVGIDSVTISNNHLYDYLDAGTQDTIRILDDVGMAWFGGGMSRDDARDNFHRVDLTHETSSLSVPISLQGFTNFYDYCQGNAYTTFADFEPVVKGGAMPAFEWEMRGFIERELDEGRIPIPVIHGGKEYSPMQNRASRNDFEVCALAGAKLVIAHHPHVVHGISTFTPPGGSDVPYFMVGSLGNLVFDQEFHETFFGYLAVVDMNVNGVVDRMELVPYYLEGYIPRPLTLSGDPSTGSAVARAARWIAHLSTQEALYGYPAEVNYDERFGFKGAVPYFENGKILVAANERNLEVNDTVETRTLSTSPDIKEVLTVHEIHSAESSLASLAIPAASSAQPMFCELGVDRLRVGGFEVDTAGGYGPENYPMETRWRTSSSRYLQSTRTRTGLGGAVLVRDSSNIERSAFSYGRRVDVTPGSNFTLQGYFTAQNAGEFEVAVTFTNSSYHETFKEGHSFSHPGGNVDEWTLFQVDVRVPMDVEEVEAYFRQYPPTDQDADIEGLIFLDDISFIEWNANATVLFDSPTAASIPTPNGWEFVRCACVDGSDCGNIDIDVTGRTYESKPWGERTYYSAAWAFPTAGTGFTVSIITLGLLML